MPSLLLIAPKKESLAKGLLPHMSLGLLAAYTPSSYDIKIVDENLEDINYDSEVDLVAITTNTRTALRAYEIAVNFMVRGVPVILGGIHVSFVPKEAKQFCTSVVIGEAEAVWTRVLRDFENSKLKPFYKSDLMDITNIKNPRRDLYPHRYLIETVQTTRGCPFNCDFCSVTAFNGAKYRFRSVSKVIDEIKDVRNRNILIVDDNILGVGKKAEARTLRLLKGMKPLNKRLFA